MTPTQEPIDGSSRPSLDKQAPLSFDRKVSLDRIGRPPTVSTQSVIPANLNITSVLYPWSRHDLSLTEKGHSPFPRYGHAANAVASKEGDVYLFGGLIDSEDIKGDLWMVEAGSGSFHCYPLRHDPEGPAPGPRVGHASLFIGNAFILFGGDTKTQETDTYLDNELYLLNVSTRQWTRSDTDRLPSTGRKPKGRYGHTLNIIGSTLYIFGGQVNHTFFNDLIAFNLNSLENPSWQFLIPNSSDGGPPEGNIPPARTNHSVITCDNKLYLFGGTNGRQWFDDVWSYDPPTNVWTRETCGGFIPKAREGHSAALVGDTMYVYGGRKAPDPAHPNPEDEDLDLADLSSFRIPTKRWFTFQNMGPEPSPRSGHTMTAFGKQIIVLGGEPSKAPENPEELGLAYVLDTSKIKYPPEADRNKRDQTASSTERSQTAGAGGRGVGPREALLARDGPLGGPMSRPQPNGRELNAGTGSKSPEPILANNSQSSRLPRGPNAQYVPGLPPQQQAPNPRTNGVTPTGGPTRVMSPVGQLGMPGPMPGALPDSRPGTALNRDINPSGQQPEYGSRGPSALGTQPLDRYNAGGTAGRLGQEGIMNGVTNRATPHQGLQQPFNESPPDSPPSSMEKLVNGRMTPEGGSFNNSAKSASQFEPTGPAPRAPEPSRELLQQNSDLTRQIEQMRRQQTWYESELALATKAGYSPRRSSTAPQPESGVEKLREDDRPMMEALFGMRAELSSLQNMLSSQKEQAKQSIAEAERQRDAAVSEAVYSRAKLAAHGGSSTSSPQPGEPSFSEMSNAEGDRYQEAQRRLAKTLAVQSGLNSRIHLLEGELEQERRARQSAETNLQLMNRRAEESESSRHRSGSESAGLRNDLLQNQRSARDESMRATQAVAELDALKLSHRELISRHDRVNAHHSQATSAIQALREAMQASAGKSGALEQKLEEHREVKEELESRLRKLQAQHDDQTGELETAIQRLRDAEALAKNHAEEARTHRAALMAGLDKVGSRGIDEDDVSRDGHTAEKLSLLQSQVESTTSLAKKHQAAADNASEKLRMAEERIAGLEAFQEQSNREEQKLRKQLRMIAQESQASQGKHQEAQRALDNQKLESSAISVQHNALKSLLTERDINPADPKFMTSRDTPSPGFGASPPDQIRLKELEERLQAGVQEQQETQALFSRREAEQDQAYNKKLDALQENHQKAMKYINDTEKVIEKMKKEAGKLKVQNESLRRDTDSRRGSPSSKTSPDPEASAAWDKERTALKREVEQLSENVKLSTSRLEAQLSQTTEELAAIRSERDHYKTAEFQHRREAEDRHNTLAQQLEHLRHANGSLEARAVEAENRAGMLLSQMESSVDNYRRQSRAPASASHHLQLHGRPDSKDGPTSHPHEPHPLQTRDLLGDNNQHGPTAAAGAGHLPLLTRDRSHSNTSGASDSTSAETSTPLGGLASARESYLSDPHGRTSLALDNLASELDALRSHWEMTSSKSAAGGAGSGSSRGLGLGTGGVGIGGKHGTGGELDSPTGRASVHLGGADQDGGGLARWRRGLGGGEDEEEEETEGEEEEEEEEETDAEEDDEAARRHGHGPGAGAGAGGADAPRGLRLGKSMGMAAGKG